MNNTLLLDGSTMPEKEFYKRFREIVGTTFYRWIGKPTTKSDGGGEWYEWNDDTYILGGTAYAPPKLYKKEQGAEITPAPAEPPRVTELFESMGAFAKEKFPDASSVEHLLKLHQEVDEAISSPSDITEYADCLLALFGAVHKAGYSFSDLLQAGFNKFDIVKSRVWERLSDGTYQHKSTKKQVTDEQIRQVFYGLCTSQAYTGYAVIREDIFIKVVRDLLTK